MNWTPPTDVLHALDLWAWGILILIVTHWLPPITIVLSFGYTLVRLYETQTIQNLLRRRKRHDHEAD